MISVHSSQRDFKCTECDKAFTNKNRLANHLRIHTGAKPFKCKICDYHSNRRDNVLLHCKKVHKVQKPTNMTCVETDETLLAQDEVWKFYEFLLMIVCDWLYMKYYRNKYNSLYYKVFVAILNTANCLYENHRF